MSTRESRPRGAKQEGEAAEAISRRVGDHVASRFGLELSEFDMAMTVAGYTIYFTKKGLI